MTSEELVQIESLTKEEFSKFNSILRQDETIFKWVSFYFNEIKCGGIKYRNHLVGLYNLDDFIQDSLSLSIAIKKEYRNLGIAHIAIQKIVLKYSSIYKNVDRFILNVSPSNKEALNAFQKMDFICTHEYDEIMFHEGAEFFHIFYKENLCRKREKK